MTTLYLTADEKKRFDALSDILKEGWTVTEEMLANYETLEQIKMRYYMADLKAYPVVQQLAERIANGDDVSDLNLDDIPAEFQKEYFFTIGARGVRALMETLLPEMTDDEDVATLASLSAIRHTLLELNASSHA